jgi:hypothetical protein
MLPCRPLLSLSSSTSSLELRRGCACASALTRMLCLLLLAKVCVYVCMGAIGGCVVCARERACVRKNDESLKCLRGEGVQKDRKDTVKALNFVGPLIGTLLLQTSANNDACSSCRLRCCTQFTCLLLQKYNLILTPEEQTLASHASCFTNLTPQPLSLVSVSLSLCLSLSLARALSRMLDECLSTSGEQLSLVSSRQVTRSSL